MRRFTPTPNHFSLNQRVKARQWGKAVAQANAVPVPEGLKGLSDQELGQRGHKVIHLNGTRFLQLFTHKHE